MPFTHLNIKGANATAILYHNVPFIEIYSIISQNPDFMFENRYTIVAPITDYIKLSKR